MIFFAIISTIHDPLELKYYRRNSSILLLHLVTDDVVTRPLSREEEGMAEDPEPPEAGQLFEA